MILTHTVTWVPGGHYQARCQCGWRSTVHRRVITARNVLRLHLKTHEL